MTSGGKGTYVIIWPDWMKKGPQPATNPKVGDTGFTADQLPEPLNLSETATVIRYDGPESLKMLIGDTLRVAKVDGGRALILDSDLRILPSVVADMDVSFSFHERQYVERLGRAFGDSRDVRSDIREGLGVDFVPEDAMLAAIRKALGGKNQNLLFESVTALNPFESALVLAEMDFRGDELTRRLALAGPFIGKLRCALRNNLDPDHQYVRVRDRFVMRQHELTDRFKTIEEHVDDSAVSAAEDVMEHYAVVSRFVEPSKDQYLDRIIGCLKHPKPMVKSFMAGALVFLKPARAYEHLLPILGDDRKAVYKPAIMALGELRDERAVEHIERFIRHKDPEVREIVVASLTAIGGEKAYKIMDDRLRRERDMVIRDDIDRGLRALEARGFGFLDNY
ncbi:MAG: HEAT repeat domain-containing protein [Candidatus Altiarchaeota archaeon]